MGLNLQLGAMIYRRLPGTPRNTTPATFSEANSNRFAVETNSLDRTENAIGLMDNEPQRVRYQNGVAVPSNWAWVMTDYRVFSAAWAIHSGDNNAATAASLRIMMPDLAELKRDHGTGWVRTLFDVVNMC